MAMAPTPLHTACAGWRRRPRIFASSRKINGMEERKWTTTIHSGRRRRPPPQQKRWPRRAEAEAAEWGDGRKGARKREGHNSENKRSGERHEGRRRLRRARGGGVNVRREADASATPRQQVDATTITLVCSLRHPLHDFFKGPRSRLAATMRHCANSRKHRSATPQPLGSLRRGPFPFLDLRCGRVYPPAVASRVTVVTRRGPPVARAVPRSAALQFLPLCRPRGRHHDRSARRTPRHQGQQSSRRNAQRIPHQTRRSSAARVAPSRQAWRGGANALRSPEQQADRTCRRSGNPTRISVPHAHVSPCVHRSGRGRWRSGHLSGIGSCVAKAHPHRTGQFARSQGDEEEAADTHTHTHTHTQTPDGGAITQRAGQGGAARARGGPVDSRRRSQPQHRTAPAAQTQPV